MAAVAGSGEGADDAAGGGSMSFAGGILVPSPSTERGVPLRMAVSPDGAFVAYPARRLVVLRSIDEPTKATIFRGHTELVRCVAISRDGQWIASGDKAGVVQVWKASNPGEVRSKGAVTVDMRDIAFDPSGDHIVVCGDDKQKANILNVDKLMTVCPSIMPMDKVALSCDWSPSASDADPVAWGGEDQRVFVYAKAAGKGFSQAKILSEAGNFVNCVRFSPAGDKLATVSSDKGVRLYEVGTGDKEGYTFVKQLGTSKGRHKGSVYTCSWSPDGKDLLTASADKTCKVWNMEDVKIRRTIPFGSDRQSMVSGAAFAGADKYVAVTLSGAVHIGNPTVKEAPEPVEGHAAPVVATAFDQSSRKMLTVDSAGKVLLWSSSSDREQSDWTPAPVSGLAQHEKFVTCGDAAGGTWATGSNDNELHIGSTDACEREAKVELGRLPPRKVAVHPGGKGVAACVTMEEVLLVQGGEVVAREVADEAVSVAFSDDGGLLFVGQKDGHVLRFECGGDGSLKKTHDEAAVGKGDSADSLLALPGGVLAVGTSGRDVMLLSSDDLSVQMARKWMYHSGSVKALGYLEEEELIVSACGAGMLCAWKRGSDKPVKVLRRPLGSSMEAMAVVGGETPWLLSNGVVQSVSVEVEE